MTLYLPVDFVLQLIMAIGALASSTAVMCWGIVLWWPGQDLKLAAYLEVRRAHKGKMRRFKAEFREGEEKLEEERRQQFKRTLVEMQERCAGLGEKERLVAEGVEIHG